MKHHDFEEPEEWEQPVADEQVPGHMLWVGFGVLDSSFRHMEMALKRKMRIYHLHLQASKTAFE